MLPVYVAKVLALSWSDVRRRLTDPLVGKPVRSIAFGGGQTSAALQRVELARLLASIDGKHANQLLVDEAEYVVALLASTGMSLISWSKSLIALVCFAAVSPNLLRPVSSVLKMPSNRRL